MTATGCVARGSRSIVDAFSLGFRVQVAEDCVGRRYADITNADAMVGALQLRRANNDKRRC